MAGLSLEGVQSIFTNGSGIRASARVEKLEKELQAGGHTKDDRQGDVYYRYNAQRIQRDISCMQTFSNLGRS